VEAEQLTAAIAAQEQLRGVVPDEVLDAAIAALRSQLGGATGPERRRRQVTVLFADVSGFTEMSELLDPEIVAELMNTLWARLDKVVVDHAGRVDKHIGDALMAVWGVEVTAEDDAERAVRAALVMQSELEQFRISSGRDLAIRVGVNTGPVLVGLVGSTNELTVMGDAVNTASRLEHAAPRNGVLIADSTYRLVRGVFDVQALEPFAAKGKTDPLKVYVAKAAKTRAFRLRSRGVEGVETSTIGRENEFAALRNAFERMVTTGQCQPVVLVGDAGVGKSRLMYEFDNWLELHELPVFYFKARAIPSRAASRFGLWRDLLVFRAGITEADSPTSVFEKLRFETSAALGGRETMILGLWLGFELSDPEIDSGLVSGENMAAVGRAHLLSYVRSLTSESPVVMLFEDLHWADDESLQLMRELPDLIASERLLAVAATRPEDRGDGETGALLGPVWEVIALDRLSDGAATALVSEILKNADEIPAQLVDLVVGRAEGNPFYIEELIKKLMDDSVIETGEKEGNWTINADLIDETSMPTTLTGVLEARLDTLPAAGRSSLQRASVVGRTFWDQAVEALEPVPPDFEHALSSELVFSQQPSTFPGSAEFKFKHALLHDVVYNTVLLRDRPMLHQRTAEWLTSVVGDRRDEFLEEIANHLLRAGLNADASNMMFEAASRALGAGDPSSAKRLSEAGLDARGSTPSHPEHHVTLATACRMLGDLSAADDEARLAIQLAEENGDDLSFVAAIREAFLISDARGQFERGKSLVQLGLPIAARLGGSSLTQMLTSSAWSELNAGQLESARTQAARCLRRAEADGETEAVLEALKVSGVIAGASGDHTASLSHYRRVLDLAMESGDLLEVTLCQLNTGVTWHLLADESSSTSNYHKAEAEYEAALALTVRLGFRSLRVRVLGNLAQLRLRLGRRQSAQTLAQECLVAAMAIGARFDSLFAILVHAEASCVDDNSLDALSHIGFVASDSALGRLAGEISEITTRLRSIHSEIDVDEALGAGESLTLEDVVEAIIGERQRRVDSVWSGPGGN
jgi:class 3 adenylate cyclase/tetratricopeptide (TPR) repeat protein